MEKGEELKEHIRKYLTQKKGSKGGREEQTRHIEIIKMANVNLTGLIINMSCPKTLIKM